MGIAIEVAKVEAYVHRHGRAINYYDSQGRVFKTEYDLRIRKYPSLKKMIDDSRAYAKRVEKELKKRLKEYGKKDITKRLD